MKYNKGDIVCVWKFTKHYHRTKIKNVLEGFAKVIEQRPHKYVKIKWMKSPKHYPEHQQYYIESNDNLTLLIPAKNVSGKEDYKSLTILIKLKYS